MNGEPRIGFATLCKGRAFHLKETLPRNLADVRDYPNAFYVVLDYESPDDLIPYLKGKHSADIQSGKLIVYSYRNGGAPLELAHGKNLAMRCAIREGAELLCQMDADNWGGNGFAKFIADVFREPGIVPGIFAIPNYALIKSLPHGANRPVRGYAGRMACWAQTFIKMGGFCESFSTWRGEDMDFNLRTTRAGYLQRHIPNNFLGAINHNSSVRFKEWPDAVKFENGNEIEILKARTETIINFGQFGCGTVYRNFDPTPIELLPVPTRIFNISLHKNGTTSLHEAFKILRLDSFHWGSGEAPLIWYEMQALGRSKTLEQWYALSDLPIPLLYRELDQAYPGSKFILTVRDEVDWLMSVKRLWDPKYNPTRYLWDIYPFTNHIHSVLYGSKDFDALVFLERYRRHNNDVRAYFKNRPNDLLVMDMDAGDGWEKLCAFLGRPIPNVPYPRANKSNEIIDAITS